MGNLEHLGKAAGVVAAWSAPAWMTVQTNNPWMSLWLLGSALCTFVWLAPTHPDREPS